MTEKELGELSPEDFESLMFDFIEREAATDDMLPDDVFFHLLAEIATRRVVEVIDLEGVIVDDQIVFRQPAATGHQWWFRAMRSCWVAGRSGLCWFRSSKEGKTLHSCMKRAPFSS